MTNTHSNKRTELESMRKYNTQKKKKFIPKSINNEKRKLYKYEYVVADNGNIYNNSTFYVRTEGIAHAHQIEEIFLKAIKKAKSMPEYFGNNFECSVKINHVVHYNGKYVGQAFVDVDNPSLYYALIGLNINGTERIEYIEKKIEHESTGLWSDEMDVEITTNKLDPILILDNYEYDEQQIESLKETKNYNGEKYGKINISPAFITPVSDSTTDDCQLYVQNLPNDDENNLLEFLYEIFSRYARDKENMPNYPKIKIFKNAEKKNFAIITFYSKFDTAFALQMNQKIRAKYNNNDIILSVRYANKNHSKKKFIRKNSIDHLDEQKINIHEF